MPNMYHYYIQDLEVNINFHSVQRTTRFLHALKESFDISTSFYTKAILMVLFSVQCCYGQEKTFNFNFNLNFYTFYHLMMIIWCCFQSDAATTRRTNPADNLGWGNWWAALEGETNAMQRFRKLYSDPWSWPWSILDPDPSSRPVEERGQCWQFLMFPHPSNLDKTRRDSPLTVSQRRYIYVHIYIYMWQ